MNIYYLDYIKYTDMVAGKGCKWEKFYREKPLSLMVSSRAMVEAKIISIFSTPNLQSHVRYNGCGMSAPWLTQAV